MSDIVLGKIGILRVGMGGYQDAMFGVTIGLAMKGSGCVDFKGTWSQSVKPSASADWTEETRSQHFATTMRWLDEQCRLAKVDDVMKLVGKPVEVTLDGLRLQSCRLLTEVL